MKPDPKILLEVLSVVKKMKTNHRKTRTTKISIAFKKVKIVGKGLN
jgi:hypothetical protein